jgi:hypothetical protein
MVLRAKRLIGQRDKRVLSSIFFVFYQSIQGTSKYPCFREEHQQDNTDAEAIEVRFLGAGKAIGPSISPPNPQWQFGGKVGPQKATTPACLK